MKKLLLLLFILALPAYAIETQDDPLAEFSEETISTYNDKTNSIIGDLEDLEDDVTTNATSISTNTPSGIIVMWSGAISAIPSGWVICDGNNGTPNLTDRFVIHADNDSGGTRDVGDTGGAQTHTLVVSEMPAHTHTANAYGGIGDWGSVFSNNILTSGHLPTTPSTNSTGGGGAHNNMPKYYALAFIQKT